MNGYAIVRFGVIWSKGKGRLAPDRQRERLRALDVDDGRMVDHWDDLPPLRSGDMVIACVPQALAGDPMTLSVRYRGVMRADGSLVLDGAGTYSTWDQFPEALKAFETARRRSQTAAARAAQKPKKTGPRPLQDAAARAEFRKLWNDPTVTQAELSRRYGVAWTTIWRWGKTLKLGPKAGT